MMLDACAMLAVTLEGCTRMRIIAALALGAALLPFQPIFAAVAVLTACAPISGADPYQIKECRIDLGAQKVLFCDYSAGFVSGKDSVGADITSNDDYYEWWVDLYKKGFYRFERRTSVLTVFGRDGNSFESVVQWRCTLMK
jgi:hypothetical protein